MEVSAVDSTAKVVRLNMISDSDGHFFPMQAVFINRYSEGPIGATSGVTG